MNLMEKLRPLLGLKNSWDYCVLWKLSQDQRFIEWVSCCCSGAATAAAAAAAASADADNIQNGGGEEELLFPVSPVRPCRDLMFQHPTTVHCDLLAQLPSCMPLNSTSGTHAQSLMANQPRWIINDSTSFSSQEAVGTRVFIPVPGGCLVEFFVAKQVYEEDPQIIEFVMAQFTLSWEQQQEAIMNLRSNSTSFQDEFDADGFASKTSSPSNSQFHHHHNQQQQQQWISPSSNTPSSSTMDGFNLPWDLSVDRIRLCSTSPMNFIGGGLPGQQLPPSLEGSMDSMAPGDKLPPQPSASFDSGFAEIASIHESLMSNAAAAAAAAYNLHSSIESSVTTNKDPPVHDTRDSTKQEIGSRADSVSGCSDQIEDDDEDDRKVVSRSGKKHQSKNLMAERNRRKKLSERLYKLRALVPNISKMDKAAILGDAIEFVKELQKQVKDLQDELEEPEEEGDRTSGNNCHKLSSSAIQLEIPNGTITEHEGSLINGPSNSLGISSNAYDHQHHNGITRCSSNTKTSTEHPSKQSPDSVNDKTHEMEVQVEVTQIDGNEFLLKVFCEHKHGGFVRLMEAMSSLGLEVTSANVTTFRPLVLNVFTVKKKDNELVQAADVRDSLLELTRNPMGLWEEPVGASENGSAIDAHLQHSHQHHLHLQHNHQQHISTAYHQQRHLHPLHHQA